MIQSNNNFNLFQEGVNPEEYAVRKPIYMSQPYLLVVGSSYYPKEYRLIVDSKAFPVGSDCFSTAVLLLLYLRCRLLPPSLKFVS